MQGAVSHHLHITAPAVEGTDYAPRTYFLVGGVRVFLSGYGFNNLTGLAFHVNNHVVAAGFGNHDVCATGSEGEFFTKGVGADAVGVTQVHIPGGILAEFHFRAGFQRDALHHVEGTVGPHLHIRAAAPVVEGTYQAPRALFGVTAIRITRRNVDLVIGNADGTGRFGETVPAVVAGHFLHGSADGHFQGHYLTFGIAHTHKGLGQVGHGNDNLTVLDGGRNHGFHRVAVHALEDHGMVHRHLLVEVLAEGTRSKVYGNIIVCHREGLQHGSRCLGGVEHGQLLLDAGYGKDGQQSCRKDG